MNREVILLILEFVIRLFVIVAIPMLYKFIKDHKLDKATRDAVWAAEQLLKKNDPTGEKRRAFVEKYVLNKFNISEEELEVLRESFVKELNLLQEQKGQV